MVSSDQTNTELEEPRTRRSVEVAVRGSNGLRLTEERPLTHHTVMSVSAEVAH